MIFGQGFLPLALDKAIPNGRAAVLVLVHPGILFRRYPTYLVSVPLSATWGGARFRTTPMEKQRGMAFGFWKTATAGKKPDRQIDKQSSSSLTYFPNCLPYRIPRGGLF